MPKTRKLAACWLTGLALLSGSVRGEDAYTAAEAVKLYRQMQPVLREAVGIAAPEHIVFEPVQERQTARYLDPVLKAQVDWQFPELKDELRKLALDEIRKVAWSTYVVEYRTIGENHSLMRLMGTHAERIAGWHASLAKITSPAFLQLVFVYGQVQMHLDRQFKLKERLGECRSRDEFEIALALRDGCALWMTGKVAKELGSEKLVPLLVEPYRHVPDANLDNTLRLVRQKVMRNRCKLATQGLGFFTYLESRAAPVRGVAVFDRPPRQLDWLAEPEKYVKALTDGRPDLASVLKNLEPLLAGKSMGQQPCSRDMLRHVAALFKQTARAERVLKHWQEGRTLIWAGSPGQQPAALSIIRFTDASAARAYFDFAADLQRQSDEKISSACGFKVQVLNSTARNLHWSEVDEAVRYDKELLVAGFDKPQFRCVILARAGDLVIECDDNAPEDDGVRRIVVAIVSSCAVDATRE